MKILALTDIHGAYALAAEIIGLEKPEVAVIGGDLTTVGTLKEAADALEEFGKHTNMLLCVAGNMDLPEHDDLFVRLGVSINGRGRALGKVGFFGVSAAPHSPLKTPYEIAEERISSLAKAGYREVQESDVKIFVPHAPPYGTKVDIIHSGIHVGSTAVRDFIEEYEPQLTICGHIHEGRGKDLLGKSTIVNCGQGSRGYYAVIETEPAMEVSLKYHKRGFFDRLR